MTFSYILAFFSLFVLSSFFPYCCMFYVLSVLFLCALCGRCVLCVCTVWAKLPEIKLDDADMINARLYPCPTTEPPRSKRWAE